MVFVCHSVEIKERCLWLLQNGYSPAKIAHLLNVHTRSIARWKSCSIHHGSVTPPHNPIQGCPTLLSSEVLQDLVMLCKESPEMYLSEIVEWMAIAHETAVSPSQLHQILLNLNISFKRLRWDASERDEFAREEWRRANQDRFHASQLLFVDETSKDDRTIYRRYGRAVSGQRAPIQANFV